MELVVVANWEDDDDNEVNGNPWIAVSEPGNTFDIPELDDTFIDEEWEGLKVDEIWLSFVFPTLLEPGLFLKSSPEEWNEKELPLTFVIIELLESKPLEWAPETWFSAAEEEIEVDK